MCLRQCRPRTRHPRNNCFIMCDNRTRALTNPSRSSRAHTHSRTHAPTLTPKPTPRLNGSAISMTYNQGRPKPHPETEPTHGGVSSSSCLNILTRPQDAIHHDTSTIVTYARIHTLTHLRAYLLACLMDCLLTRLLAPFERVHPERPQLPSSARQCSGIAHQSP